MLIAVVVELAPEWCSRESKAVVPTDTDENEGDMVVAFTPLDVEEGT